MDSAAGGRGLDDEHRQLEEAVLRLEAQARLRATETRESPNPEAMRPQLRVLEGENQTLPSEAPRLRLLPAPSGDTA